MRFVHTADWQLGMKAAHVGAKGDLVRAERLAAVERLVALATEAEAEFMVIAGDAFEDNGIDRLLVQQAARTLVGFDRPVYLLPGNHDPLVPGSVWEDQVWRDERLTVLERAEPVPVDGGVLYPCPLTTKRSGADPTGWLSDVDRPEAICIGVAHGAVLGLLPDELDFPIARDAPARASLDYLALGHWHSLSEFPDDSGVVRMAYSGTPETTRFGETGGGKALLVEVAAPGAVPLLTPLQVGRLHWLQVERDLHGESDLAALRHEIEELDKPELTLLDLRLSGLLPAEAFAELERLKVLLQERCLYARVERRGLRPTPEDDAWVAALPTGLLGEVATRLRALSDPGFPMPRGDGESAEVAAQALVELYALVQEVPG